MKKEIIINETNRERINREIDEAQGRSYARCINGYDELVRIVEEIESRFKELGIKKKNWNGVVADYCKGAQEFPARYNGIPISTYVDITWSNGKARLSDVGRYRTRVHEYRFNFTQEAKSDIIENASTMY